MTLEPPGALGGLPILMHVSGAVAGKQAAGYWLCSGCAPVHVGGTDCSTAGASSGNLLRTGVHPHVTWDVCLPQIAAGSVDLRADQVLVVAPTLDHSAQPTGFAVSPTFGQDFNAAKDGPAVRLRSGGACQADREFVADFYAAKLLDNAAPRATGRLGHVEIGKYRLAL